MADLTGKTHVFSRLSGVRKSAITLRTADQAVERRSSCMSRTMTRDLTEGRPLKQIVSFALPLLFGVLFQQLYSFVDTAVVGRFLGPERLAAWSSASAWACVPGFPFPSPRLSERRTNGRSAAAYGTRQCSAAS